MDASTPDIPSGPLTSTPKKQKSTFGTALSPATRNANNGGSKRNSVYTPTKKAGAGDLAGQVRDSKELVDKSPGNAKTLLANKNAGEQEGKENAGYWQGRSPRKAVKSPQKQTQTEDKASSTSPAINASLGRILTSCYSR